MSAFTTATAVKEYLRISHSNWDALITSLITRMSGFFESQINRTLDAADYTERYDGEEDNGGVLRLKHPPINSVTSLHDDINRAFGASTLIATADYVWYANEGVIRLDGAEFRVGLQNIQVVYNGGYDTIPDDVVQAVIELVAFKLIQSDTGGVIKQRELADAKFVYRDGVAVPEDTMLTITKYQSKDMWLV